MKRPLDVLIVEDSEDDARLLTRELDRGGYAVTALRVETAETFRAALTERRWDAIFCDYSLPRFDGRSALRIAQESGCDLPFIFVSGAIGEDLAVEAMKAGAHDYVMKSDLTRLVPAMEREMRDALDRRQHREAERQMRMSEQKYRHLFRCMGDAALLVAAESGRIIDANEQAEVLFERTRDELLGLNCARLYASGAAMPSPEIPSGASSGPSACETLVQRPGGVAVPVHVSVSYVRLYERPFTLALFRDITERKRAEAGLRNVLRHARTIVMDAVVTAPPGWPEQTAGDDAAELNWEWRVQDAQAAGQVLPLAVPEGSDYLACWLAARHSGDWAALTATAANALRTGTATWQQQFRCADRNGQWRVFIQAAFVDTMEAGRWRVTTVNTDITDRVEAEEALRTSEQRLATVFNLSPTAICIVRCADNRFVAINDAFAAGTGYTRDEIIGHTPTELQLWTDDEERAAIVRSLETSDNAVAFKLKGRRKSGETGVGLASMARIPLHGEEHLLTLIQDITELDRAEKARRESDERFRQLAETIDEVFWLTDVKKRRMIYISPAYTRVWGRPRESLLADPQCWLATVHETDAARVSAALPLQASGNYDLEYRIVRPDGQVRWIHERAFPVRDAAGNVYRIAGVASDMTVRRELEEQFRQSQKMEAVGQLAGGIAHDFNNLLTVIELQSSVLAELLHGQDEAEAGIRQILEAARRAAKLTRQLLTFSRRQSQAAQDLDLGEVLGGMTKMLRRVLGEDISLESRFAPGLPHVQADPGMMEQVLMNLSINARDAMPQGGRLLISLDPVLLDAASLARHPSGRVGEFVCLTVSDTGSGIAPDIRSRVFEPFFTTKEMGKGTGLGLATVFGIVEQHKGWIELDSEVGKGTTFRVYLPARPPASGSTGVESEAPRAAGGSETILVVEDEDSVRSMAAASLRQRGYRVLEAGSASEAVARWNEHQGKVDLLLTDLIMPGGVTGKDLVEELRKSTPQLRAVYTTGYSASSVGRQLDLKRGENFLEKPYSLEALAAIVRVRLDTPDA